MVTIWIACNKENENIVIEPKLDKISLVTEFQNENNNWEEILDKLHFSSIDSFDLNSDLKLLNAVENLNIELSEFEIENGVRLVFTNDFDCDGYVFLNRTSTFNERKTKYLSIKPNLNDSTLKVVLGNLSFNESGLPDIVSYAVYNIDGITGEQIGQGCIRRTRFRPKKKGREVL